MKPTRQELMDHFYTVNGPCCAGCDWWHYINGLVGECLRSAPVSGAQRASMLGIHGASIQPGSGHVMTRRDHHCGDFKDEFDWDSLPADYLRRIVRIVLPAEIGEQMP